MGLEVQVLREETAGSGERQALSQDPPCLGAVFSLLGYSREPWKVSELRVTYVLDCLVHTPERELVGRSWRWVDRKKFSPGWYGWAGHGALVGAE